LPVLGVVLVALALVIYVVGGAQVKQTLGGPDWAAMCAEARESGTSLTGTYETICRDLEEANNPLPKTLGSPPYCVGLEGRVPECAAMPAP
jgi:hypothetical protein